MQLEGWGDQSCRRSDKVFLESKLGISSGLYRRATGSPRAAPPLARDFSEDRSTQRLHHPLQGSRCRSLLADHNHKSLPSAPLLSLTELRSPVISFWTLLYGSNGQMWVCSSSLCMEWANLRGNFLPPQQMSGWPCYFGRNPSHRAYSGSGDHQCQSCLCCWGRLDQKKTVTCTLSRTPPGSDICIVQLLGARPHWFPVVLLTWWLYLQWSGWASQDQTPCWWVAAAHCRWWVQ